MYFFPPLVFHFYKKKKILIQHKSADTVQVQQQFKLFQFVVFPGTFARKSRPLAETKPVPPHHHSSLCVRHTWDPSAVITAGFPTQHPAARRQRHPSLSSLTLYHGAGATWRRRPRCKRSSGARDAWDAWPRLRESALQICNLPTFLISPGPLYIEIFLRHTLPTWLSAVVLVWVIKRAPPRGKGLKTSEISSAFQLRPFSIKVLNEKR